MVFASDVDELLLELMLNVVKDLNGLLLGRVDLAQVYRFCSCLQSSRQSQRWKAPMHRHDFRTHHYVV